MSTLFEGTFVIAHGYAIRFVVDVIKLRIGVVERYLLAFNLGLAFINIYKDKLVLTGAAIVVTERNNTTKYIGYKFNKLVSILTFLYSTIDMY